MQQITSPGVDHAMQARAGDNTPLQEIEEEVYRNVTTTSRWDITASSR